MTEVTETMPRGAVHDLGCRCWPHVDASEVERLRALFQHIVDNESEGDVPLWISKIARRGLDRHV
jgi:hypothetical protein